MTGGQGVKVNMVGATGGLVSQMKHSAFKFYGNEAPTPNQGRQIIQQMPTLMSSSVGQMNVTPGNEIVNFPKDVVLQRKQVMNQILKQNTGQEINIAEDDDGTLQNNQKKLTNYFEQPDDVVNEESKKNQ